MSTPTVIPFQRLLDALQAVDKPFSPRYLYRLSDLEESDLEKLRAIWGKIPVRRRQALMQDVEELSSKDTLLNFVALSRFALQDEDPRVRLLAVCTLGDYEENNLIQVFLQLLKTDGDTEVREAAARALGRFVYAGELDEISATLLRTIEDTLLSVINSEELPGIRRAALEAMGYSSRDEIIPIIETAFTSNDQNWKASAVFAMGRSANIDWQPQIMATLQSKLPLLRCQAARAAGELEISEAIPYLIELIDDPDDDTRLASIWSLSQIGGEGVRETLERMQEETEDDRDYDFLESALENLSFNEDLQLMPLFDFPENNETDLDEHGLDDVPELFEDDEDSEY